MRSQTKPWWCGHRTCQISVSITNSVLVYMFQKPREHCSVNAVSLARNNGTWETQHVALTGPFADANGSKLSVRVASDRATLSRLQDGPRHEGRLHSRRRLPKAIRGRLLAVLHQIWTLRSHRAGAGCAAGWGRGVKISPGPGSLHSPCAKDSTHNRATSGQLDGGYRFGAEPATYPEIYRANPVIPRQNLVLTSLGIPPGDLGTWVVGVSL